MSGEDNIDIPVKDAYDGKAVRGNNPKITRNEIEDRYLSVAEENLILKKHLRKQEEKIKLLATKLVRILGDRKKHEKRGDILLEDQKCRINELEAQVNSLRDKLTVSRQQLSSYTKLVPGIHRHIKPKPMRSATLPLGHSQSDGSAIVSDHVTHLLMEARAENQALKDRLVVLHGHMSSTETELSQLKQEITLKEVERQSEMITLRSEGDFDNDSKKKKLADNVNFIRLQRDSKRTASWLATYEAQCRTLESNLNEANESLSQVEYQLAEAQEELRQEQHKSIGLMKQAEDFSAVALQLKEMETRLKSLQDENRILKDGHESLVAKALENVDKIQKVEQEESSYKKQISQLENSIRGELQAKAELIATINQEKAKSTSIEHGFRELEIKSEQLADNLRKTEIKLEEAEHQLSERKPGEIKLPDSCEGCGRLEGDLNQVQWQLVQVREELTKTKNLLKTQISINKEYQKEIEILSTKLEKSEVFHHDKLQEFMKALEERAEQMSLLEKSLESLNKKSPMAHIFTEPIPIVNNQPEDPPLMPILTLPPQASSTPNTTSFHCPEDSTLPSSIVESTKAAPPSPEPSELKPIDQEIEHIDKLPLPVLNQQDSAETTELVFPTLEIHINRFIPTRGTQLDEGLFVTWELDESARNYSPLVADGVFDVKAQSALRSTNFPLEGIEVQLHKAVGTLHCRMLATAFIVPGSNVSVAMHSVESDEIIGDLTYSCTLLNYKENDFAGSTAALDQGIESDLRNNNVEFKDSIPIPKPKAKPRTPSSSQPPTEVEDDGFGSEVEILSPYKRKSRKSSNEKSPRKSILRKDGDLESPRKPQMRVSVSEEIDEREFQNEFKEDADVEVDADGPPNFVPVAPLSDIHEETSAIQSVSEQRKKRRRKKAPKLKTNMEEESELTYSLESASGTETSRNVSDMESMEEEYSKTGMRIEISYVQFNEHCRLWNDPRIKKFFVEYSFLNYSHEDLETETSLHKPQPGHKAQFNFVKVFLIDTSEKRRLLKEMLKERKRLRFVIVSEPSDDDTIDCEDLGYSYVSFNDLIEADADLIEEEIPIYDAENHRLQVGVMCVSVHVLQVLTSL